MFGDFEYDGILLKMEEKSISVGCLGCIGSKGGSIGRCLTANSIRINLNKISVEAKVIQHQNKPIFDLMKCLDHQLD